jgi:hypothetical protein
MDSMLQPMGGRVMVWLDDLLPSSTDEQELLKVHQQFFELCRTNRVLLHAAKCEFFCVQVRWCGRIISADGVKYDPRHLQGLLDMSPPAMGDQLMQFVCALGWLRTSMPEFTTVIAPLAELMNNVYSAAGGLRTKRAVSKIPLTDVGWSRDSAACFERCKNSLLHATSLAHRNEHLGLCVYTDASERHWSSVITQVPPADLNEPHADQRHEPLAFLSGTFVGAPFRWSIANKEGCAIVQTCERMDYLLRCPAGLVYSGITAT